MNELTITVCMATIPPRQERREQVLADLAAQTRPADDLSVHMDEDGIGAARARDLAVAGAAGDFVAFVDDDDRIYPTHLEVLEAAQVATGADMVYPWHDIEGDIVNPLAVCGQSPEGRPWDRAACEWLIVQGNFIPVTTLVRRSLFVQVGGFNDMGCREWDPGCCELWDLWKRLLCAGAQFAHAPQRTWRFSVHNSHTGGLDWRRHATGPMDGYRNGDDS